VAGVHCFVSHPAWQKTLLQLPGFPHTQERVQVAS
jgi:hypothetical protein